VHPPFEILEHPADIGFLAYGVTLEELFSNAALALHSLACSPEGIEEREQREIEATGADTESLLFSWLAEILAVADAERLVFRRCTVTEFTAARIRGMVWGEPYDPARHRAGTYIKAVTYHQFCVDKITEGWRARVFLDL